MRSLKIAMLVAVILLAVFVDVHFYLKTGFDFLLPEGQTAAVAVATGNPVGYFDSADCSAIQGWTYDGDNVSASVSIDIYQDGPYGSGTYLGRFSANSNRPDVNAIYNNSIGSNHGYYVTTPDSLKDSKSHSLYIYAINFAGTAGTNVLLTGSPKTIICTPSTVAPTTPIPTPTPINPVTGTKNVTGYLDSASCALVQGWTCDPNVLNSPTTIQIYKDGTFGSGGVYVGSYQANAARAGSLFGYCGDGANHGFSIPTPSAFLDGSYHTLYTYGIHNSGDTASNVLLGNSPKTLACSSGGISIDTPVFGVQSTLTDNNDSAKLSWQPVSGAVGYAIYRDGLLVNSSATASFTDDPVLMPDTTYTYDVLAMSSNNSVVSTTLPPNIPVSNVVIVVTPPAPKFPIRGTVKILNIILNYDGNTSPVETLNSVSQKMFLATSSVANYYYQNSFHNLSITGDVAGPVKLPININAATTTFASITGPVVAHNADLDTWYTAYNETVYNDGEGFDPSKYDLVIYTWPNVGGTIRGVVDNVGNIGGDIKGRLWINGVQDARTYAHEIGHKLGLVHAQGIICNSYPLERRNLAQQGCMYSYYNDPVDVMGNFSYNNLDPFRKALLGWEPLYPIVETGLNLITPTEKYGNAFTVSGNDAFYNLDYRTTSGFDPANPNIGAGINIEFSYTPQKTFVPIDNTFVETQYLVVNPSFYRTAANVPSGASMPHVPISTLNDGAVFTDKETPGLEIIQVSHSTAGAFVFVRLPTPAPTLNLKWNGVPDQAGLAISWTSVYHATGYELYRDSTTTVAIYSGTGNVYVDNLHNADFINSTHTYYVRAYDAFQINGVWKKYYMPFSAGVKSSTIIASATGFTTTGLCAEQDKYIASTPTVSQTFYSAPCFIGELINLTSKQYSFKLLPSNIPATLAPNNEIYVGAAYNATGVVVQ